MEGQTIKAEPQLYLCLVPARHDGRYRQAITDFWHALRLQNVDVTPRYYVNDAVSGGGLSGEFGFMAAAIGPVVFAAIGAFLNARYGRKVRLRIGLDGEVEAEAQTVEQIEKLMEVVERHRKGKDGPPCL